MAVLDGSACAIKWVIDSLRAASAVTNLVGNRITTLPIPPNLQYPVIGISYNRDKSPDLIDGEIALVHVYLNIMAIGSDRTIDALVPINAAIKSTIHQMYNTYQEPNEYGLVTSCVWEHHIHHTEPDEQFVTWNYYGGQYCIGVQTGL